MSMINGTIKTKDVSLFTIKNNVDSKVNVLIVHGYAEHIVRYEHFMAELEKSKFNIMGYDHRGHGQSEGKRALVSSFEEYVDDMKLVVDQFFQEDKKNFIFAHSMGGLVLLQYLQKFGNNKIDGVITSGAALHMYEKTPPILEKISGFIAAVLPSLPTLSVDASTVSRNPEVVSTYKSDPLNYTKGTKAKFGYEFLKAQKLVEKALDKITIPILIMHGKEDKLIDPASSQIIHDSISSKDKSLILWDELYHEILNEPEWKMVSDSIIKWIKERL